MPPGRAQRALSQRSLYELAHRRFLPLALLILSVLGAIMFGLATPSEAAAIGALGALVLAAAYRSLTFEKLKESVFLTARTSAMVGWLFVGSFIFSAVFATLGGDAVIKDFVVGLDLSPLMFLIVTQIIIFILGWPLEWTEIIVIFVPIFLPLLEHFGIDPLFFGLLIALNIQTSFLSPPVAMAPFYLKGVAPKHVNINDIFAGVMPFIFIVLVAMVLLYVFPESACGCRPISMGAGERRGQSRLPTRIRSAALGTRFPARAFAGGKSTSLEVLQRSLQGIQHQPIQLGMDVRARSAAVLAYRIGLPDRFQQFRGALLAFGQKTQVNRAVDGGVSSVRRQLRQPVGYHGRRDRRRTTEIDEAHGDRDVLQTLSVERLRQSWIDKNRRSYSPIEI